MRLIAEIVHGSLKIQQVEGKEGVSLTPMTIIVKPARKLLHGFHENTVDSGRRDEGSRFQLVVSFREKSKTEGNGEGTKKPIPHTG